MDHYQKIVTNTECDCSSLVRACIIQATMVDVGNITTASLATTLEKSGLFLSKGKCNWWNYALQRWYSCYQKQKGHTVYRSKW